MEWLRSVVARVRSRFSSDSSDEVALIDPTQSQSVLGVKKPELKPQDMIEISVAISKIESELLHIKSKLISNDIVRKPKSKPVLRPWITNNIFFLTLVWQFIGVTIAHVSKTYAANDDIGFIIAVVFMFFTQALNLIIIIILNVKLIKQLSHKTATGWFLMQSYLSCVVIFAGIYSLIFLINADLFGGIAYNSNTNMFVVFEEFTYFSLTIMSTVGLGDISPISWTTQCVVMIEILLAVLYTTVIFARGLSYFSGDSPSSRSLLPTSETDLHFIAQPVNYGATDTDSSVNATGSFQS